MDWTRGPTIGRGSTATVSLATCSLSGELFAVKSAELSHSMLLQKEQRLLSKLTCPYIIKYMGYDVTNENSKPVYNLCMEYVPGGTLHDVIQGHGGRLDEAVIRLYTRNILQGLDYLHGKVGLVHCDIKSRNVLIGEDGAKIADFGCSRFVQEVAGDVSGVVSGTPAFMAPEVARGDDQGFPADVWAVGCTVIEMATGSNPWAAELNDPVSALYKIGFSAEVPEFPSWLSEEGKDFLTKCLRRDPKERWTATELLDHPFLQEMDQLESMEVKNLTTGSPCCVLDQGFWDSMEESPVSPENLTLESCSSSNSAAERIARFLGGISTSSAPEEPNWTWQEDWITVRSNDDEEESMILGNEASVATGFFHSDLVVHENELESSVFDEDDLLLQDFHVENISDNGSGISDVSDHTNIGTSVSKNLNFEADNDNSVFFPSISVLSLLPFLLVFSLNFSLNLYSDTAKMSVTGRKHRISFLGLGAKVMIFNHPSYLNGSILLWDYNFPLV